MRSQFDLHSNCIVTNALDQQAIGSSTTTVGNIIDTKDANIVEFIAQLGTITDGAYVVSLEHGDDSGLSDTAAVSAEETLGGISFALTEDKVCKRMGYVGKKRYVRPSITSSAVTTGVDFAGMSVLLAGKMHNPQANQ
jgi:hypothetical protein